MEPKWFGVRHVGVRADSSINTSQEPAARQMRSHADLEELFLAHRGSMVRLGRLLTGSVAVAEEVVQESFIKLFERRATVDNPVAYLHRTVVNGCHSRMRRRKNEASKLAILGTPSEIQQPAMPVETAEIWESLNSLTQRQRTAIVLRFYNDMTTVATAEAMGVRPGTVKSLVHRGLEQLRKEIQHG